MPGPYRHRSDNTVYETPVKPNEPKVKPPLENRVDVRYSPKAKRIDDKDLFINNGGFE